jgi:glyoxylase-like metal-dependent hydrolase (beta-lactamase superfamily II)
MPFNPIHDKILPLTSLKNGEGRPVLGDIYCLTVQIVNVYFVGPPEQVDDWVLVDAGMPRSENAIIKAVRMRFGHDAHPRAIVLTHGHFDHVGAVVELAERWQVPVYVHAEEMPFITGQQAYPGPDPTAGGGLVTQLSWLFPNKPVDLGDRVRVLPEDGSVPDLSGWRWVHTPGHTPGHISLFREDDRALIAGDAFVTVQQESLCKVFTQKQEISGPPRYFTSDWTAAHESVKKLAALEPHIAMTGHGSAMAGDALTAGLRDLAANFKRRAMP